MKTIIVSTSRATMSTFTACCRLIIQHTTYDVNKTQLTLSPKPTLWSYLMKMNTCIHTSMHVWSRSLMLWCNPMMITTLYFLPPHGWMFSLYGGSTVMSTIHLGGKKRGYIGFSSLTKKTLLMHSGSLILILLYMEYTSSLHLHTVVWTTYLVHHKLNGTRKMQFITSTGNIII